MSDQLSEFEKVRIRGHMGYPQVRKIAGFALGTPAAIETSFIIELAMNEVTIDALPFVRDLVKNLDCIEAQMMGNLPNQAAVSVGEITVNNREQLLLDGRYDRWLRKLEEALSVSRNPYSKHAMGGGPGLNIGVRG